MSSGDSEYATDFAAVHLVGIPFMGRCGEKDDNGEQRTAEGGDTQDRHAGAHMYVCMCVCVCASVPPEHLRRFTHVLSNSNFAELEPTAVLSMMLENSTMMRSFLEISRQPSLLQYYTDLKDNLDRQIPLLYSLVSHPMSTTNASPLVSVRLSVCLQKAGEGHWFGDWFDDRKTDKVVTPFIAAAVDRGQGAPGRRGLPRRWRVWSGGHPWGTGRGGIILMQPHTWGHDALVDAVFHKGQGGTMSYAVGQKFAHWQQRDSSEDRRMSDDGRPPPPLFPKVDVCICGDCTRHSNHDNNADGGANVTLAGESDGDQDAQENVEWHICLRTHNVRRLGFKQYFPALVRPTEEGDTATHTQLCFASLWSLPCLSPPGGTQRHSDADGRVGR